MALSPTTPESNNEDSPKSIEPKESTKAKQRLVRSIIVVVGLLVGTALVLPFFLPQHTGVSSSRSALRLLNTHDLGTLFAIMEQFDKGLRSAVLYPRWLPDINYGYGVATMVFYPPGLFYLSSLVHAVVNDWVATILVIAALSMAASGISLYLLARMFYGTLASVVAALFYMLLPYHSLDLYWRGALPEFMAFAFLPLIMCFAFKLGSEGRLRYYAVLGLFYGLYLMTHLPTGYLFTYALGFYALVRGISSKDLRITLRIAGGMTIGLLLSAVYWLPAALEGKHTHEFVSDIFPYHRSYITLYPGNNAFDDLVNSTFTYPTLALLVAIVILRAIRRRNENLHPGQAVHYPKPVTALWFRDSSDQGRTILPPLGFQTRLWMIMAIATTFMSTSFSVYISKLIPNIQISVPAWRWLAIASLFVSLLVGATVEQLSGRVELRKTQMWAYRAAIGAAIVLNVWLTVGSVIPMALANGDYVRPYSFSTAGFIPKDATYPGQLPDTPRAMLEPNVGAAEVTIWEPQQREVIVRVDQPSELRLRTYNFPGWTARIDGQSAALSSDKDGVQLVSVPPGRHKIEIEFVDTPPRKLGTVCFALGLSLIVGLAAADHASRIKEGTKAKFINGLAPQEQNTKLVARRKIKIVLASLVALAVMMAGLTLIRSRNSEGKPSSSDMSKGGAAESDTQIHGTLEPNAETRLYVSGLNSIPVAVDENALSEMMTAFPIGKNERVEELVQSGRLFRVANNTRVRILAVGSAKVKVRVLEGESVTLEGWVPERWVR